MTPQLSGSAWYSAHCQAIKAAQRHRDKADCWREFPLLAAYHDNAAAMLLAKAITFLERAQSSVSVPRSTSQPRMGHD